MYAIYESEMNTLSTLNHVSTAAFSLSASFLSFAGGLIIQDKIAPATTAQGQAIVALGVPGGGVMALVCLAVGIYAWRKRGGTLEQIKNESRAVQTVGSAGP